MIVAHHKRWYLQLIDNDSNTRKHYLVAVTEEKDDKGHRAYVVRAAWGRIGNKLQTKQIGIGSHKQDAMKKAEKQVRDKIKKGYQEKPIEPKRLRLGGAPDWWGDGAIATDVKISTTKKRNTKPSMPDRSNAEWNF
jgi:predicted DNA-binding WGR domain protein